MYPVDWNEKLNILNTFEMHYLLIWYEIQLILNNYILFYSIHFHEYNSN